MTFGEKLKQLRTINNLTQEELAEKLFVTRTAVSKWETNKGFPAIDSLKLISQLFQISIDELISDDDIAAKRVLDAKRTRVMYGVSMGFLAITAMFALLTYFLRKPLFNIGSMLGCIGYVAFALFARPRDGGGSAKKSKVAYIISRVGILIVVGAVIVGTIVRLT